MGGRPPRARARPPLHPLSTFPSFQRHPQFPNTPVGIAPDLDGIDQQWPRSVEICPRCQPTFAEIRPLFELGCNRTLTCRQHHWCQGGRERVGGQGQTIRQLQSVVPRLTRRPGTAMNGAELTSNSPVGTIVLSDGLTNKTGVKQCNCRYKNGPRRGNRRNARSFPIGAALLAWGGLDRTFTLHRLQHTRITRVASAEGIGPTS